MTSTPTAVSRYEIGMQSFAKGDYESAAAIWQEASGNTMSVEEARKIADGLSAIAVHYSRSRINLSDVEPLLKRALEIRRQYLPLNDQSIGIELSNLGMHYAASKQREKALQALEEGCALLTTISPPTESVADVLLNLAGGLFDEGVDLLRAAELSKRGLDIYDQLLGRINPKSVSTLELLARIQDAIKPHSKTGRMLRAEYTARLPELAKSLQHKGDPLLAEALFVASQIGKRQSQQMVDTAVAVATREWVLRSEAKEKQNSPAPLSHDIQTR